MEDEVEAVVVSVTEAADEEAEGVVELEVGAVEFAAADGLIADKLAVGVFEEADKKAVFEEGGKIAAAVGCNLAELDGRTDT